MTLDFLAVWESSKKQLDGYSGQLKEIRKQKAGAEGELEAIEEFRRPVVERLAALRQRHEDLEMAMKVCVDTSWVIML